MSWDGLADDGGLPRTVATDAPGVRQVLAAAEELRGPSPVGKSRRARSYNSRPLGNGGCRSGGLRWDSSSYWVLA